MALGKGLDALLGDFSLQTQESNTNLLPISQIQPGAKQPRKRFEPEAITALADSIREHGLIQPLTVRRLGSGYYQIIAGERRWRAAKEAGLTQVPAMIIDADERKVMELGLIENLQREDLNPMEVAKGYQTLISEHGLTQEEVAQRMGVSRPSVANALRLLELPDPVQYLLEEGKLSAGHARAILMAPLSRQKELAQTALDKGLSVRATEELARKMAKREEEGEPTPPPADQATLYLYDLEDELSKQFGRKIRFQRYNNPMGGGSLLFHYDSLDDLNELVDKLRGGEPL